MSKQSCALCCSLLSAFGAIFLAIVGVLINSQPQYIKSLGKDTDSSPVFNTGKNLNKIWPQTDSDIAILYAALFAASVGVYFVESRKNEMSTSKYEQMSERIEGITNEKTPLLSR
ncbi:hypothetical protein THRCLA_22308 [Thraustotheca clavata]|uniref:Uncharacterized protein n=1 Tax=Thraustotheca clavata TaxID=74557 RepID=A0A1V9Z6A0_9STRA|nr:hypothetical protein THRCLA_22308 [Thraustotheca clavata]